jgi:hypothetical protein
MNKMDGWGLIRDVQKGNIMTVKDEDRIATYYAFRRSEVLKLRTEYADKFIETSDGSKREPLWPFFDRLLVGLESDRRRWIGGGSADQ